MRRAWGGAGAAGDRSAALGLDRSRGRQARRAAHQPNRGGPLGSARHRSGARDPRSASAGDSQPGARVARHRGPPGAPRRGRLRIRPTNLQSLRRDAPVRDRGARQRRRGARGPAGHRRPLLQLSHHRRLVAAGGVAPRQADSGARPAEPRRRRRGAGERAGGGPGGGARRGFSAGSHASRDDDG